MQHLIFPFKLSFYTTPTTARTIQARQRLNKRSGRSARFNLSSEKWREENRARSMDMEKDHKKKIELQLVGRILAAVLDLVTALVVLPSKWCVSTSLTHTHTHH
jgi:hypothetical protein